MTRDAEFLAYVAGLVAPQLAAVGLFARRLARDRWREAPAPARRVCVIVACKGEIPRLVENAKSFLSQRRVDAEFLFVTPRVEDPAALMLAPALRGQARARLLASGAVPSSCSGKIADMLHAVGQADPAADVLVFADADLAVRPDWLERLVAPLAEPRFAVATSCAFYVAADAGFWTFLRMAWFGALLPYLALSGCVIGHSMALRRRDFEDLRVAEIWSRCVLEDLALGDVVRRAGRQVAFVFDAVSLNQESCDRREYFGQLNKWVLLLRVYDKRLWLPAFVAVFAHGWIFYWCLRAPRTLWLPAVLLFGDAAAVGAAFYLYERRAGALFSAARARYRPLWLWAAAAAPLLWASYAVQLLASLTTSRIRWGGRVYRLRGPRDVEVVG